MRARAGLVLALAVVLGCCSPPLWTAAAAPPASAAADVDALDEAVAEAVGLSGGGAGGAGAAAAASLGNGGQQGAGTATAGSDPAQMQMHRRASAARAATTGDPADRDRGGDSDRDHEAFVMFCLCMGRFGNQIDHLLGGLALARKLQRTVVLPPIIHYPSAGSGRGIRLQPFDELFQLEAVQAEQPAVTMETFMATRAAEVWPPAQRLSHCYQRRGSPPLDCHVKSGTPPKDFWDHYGITFAGSAHAEVLYYSTPAQWEQAFPRAQHRVLAPATSPGPYPVEASVRPLQRLLQWQPAITQRARAFLDGRGLGGFDGRGQPVGSGLAFVATHLRVGSDFERACEHGVGRPAYMSSPQCPSVASVTQDVCFPSIDHIVKTLKRALKTAGAKTLFVGTDDPDIVPKLKKRLGKKITVVTSDDGGPIFDLRVFGLADVFVGNCVSSFTAFAKRERDLNNLPTSFFGVSAK